MVSLGCTKTKILKSLNPHHALLIRLGSPPDPQSSILNPLRSRDRPSPSPSTTVFRTFTRPPFPCCSSTVSAPPCTFPPPSSATRVVASLPLRVGERVGVR